jgi:hypothetical protein
VTYEKIYGNFHCANFSMSKLCKRGCEVAESDKFCKDHGDLEKCKNGHYILVATNLCKEDNDPPFVGEVAEAADNV